MNARSRRAAAVSLLTSIAVACGTDRMAPASLDAANESCSMCRMAVSDVPFASQIVAPGEIPRFFDDLGCLSRFIRTRTVPSGAIAYVADHRTREWVRAAAAVYTHAQAIETPMGSQIVAHASAASRDQDKEAAGGTPVDPKTLFPSGAPDGPAAK